jgi:hypothetical protein
VFKKLLEKEAPFYLFSSDNSSDCITLITTISVCKKQDNEWRTILGGSFSSENK